MKVAPGAYMYYAGEVDRVALGQLVFRDAAARRRLNASTHLPIAVALFLRLLSCWLRHCSVVVSHLFPGHHFNCYSYLCACLVLVMPHTARRAAWAAVGWLHTSVVSRLTQERVSGFCSVLNLHLVCVFWGPCAGVGHAIAV